MIFERVFNILKNSVVLNRFVRTLKTDRITLLCFIIFCLFVFMGVVLTWLLPSPTFVHENFLRVPPFWQEGGSFQFILGTDDNGRNLLARLVRGAWWSMLIGSGVVGLSLMVGTFLGLIAGYFGGWVDRRVMDFVNILMSFPSILIAILIVTVLGPGLWNAIVAVNVTYWPQVIRIVRSVVLREREKEYVHAVQSFGAGRFRILVLNILPNCVGPLIVQGTLGFGEGILGVAALGFLGLGAVPPTPEWGVMISDGRALMETAWWLITLPGLFLFLLVWSVNIIGESLRDAFDPKS